MYSRVPKGKKEAKAQVNKNARTARNHETGEMLNTWCTTIQPRKHNNACPDKNPKNNSKKKSIKEHRPPKTTTPTKQTNRHQSKTHRKKT